MAVRDQFNDTVIDTSGNSMSGVEVTVYVGETATKATLYTTKTGGGTVANPVTSPSNGQLQFWLPPGLYRIVYHDTQLPARFTDRTIYWSATSGDTQGIAGTQIENQAITSARLHPDVQTDLGYNSLSPGTAKFLKLTGLADRTVVWGTANTTPSGSATTHDFTIAHGQGKAPVFATFITSDGRILASRNGTHTSTNLAVTLRNVVSGNNMPNTSIAVDWLAIF